MFFAAQNLIINENFKFVNKLEIDRRCPWNLRYDFYRNLWNILVATKTIDFISIAKETKWNCTNLLSELCEKDVIISFSLSFSFIVQKCFTIFLRAVPIKVPEVIFAPILQQKWVAVKWFMKQFQWKSDRMFPRHFL